MSKFQKTRTRGAMYLDLALKFMLPTTFQVFIEGRSSLIREIPHVYDDGVSLLKMSRAKEIVESTELFTIVQCWSRDMLVAPKTLRSYPYALASPPQPKVGGIRASFLVVLYLKSHDIHLSLIVPWNTVCHTVNFHSFCQFESS